MEGIIIAGMKAPRLKRQGFVGVLPDGRHCVVSTKNRSDAFIAECRECGDCFDNDDPAFTVANGVALHKQGTGHSEFNYFTLTLAKVETAP